MTTPRGFRDRANDGILTLIGDVPELVRNLVIAEVDAAKAWAAKTAKDAGIGAGWIVGALFFLFWAVSVFGIFLIWGIAEWANWPIWASSLLVLGILILIAALFLFLGYLRFKKLSSRENPVEAVKTDVEIVREVGDEF